MTKQLIICDNNKNDLQKTRSTVEQFIQNNKLDYVIFEFISGKQLIEACKEGRIHPDIIFMDIELDQEMGIDVVKMINEIIPETHVVYITNYLQYATDVYTTEHRYYVLKPELQHRLQGVFDKIIRMSNHAKEDVVIHLKQNVEIVLNKKDIILLEREGRGTKIEAMVDGVIKYYYSNMKLKEIAEQVGNIYITQCHNSFFVGFPYIKLYKRDSILMETDELIPISRKYQPSVRQEFTKWTKEHLF